jgi:hypothetical protein
MASAAITVIDSVKGAAMQEGIPAHISDLAEAVLEKQPPVETTLYDLIVAIREAVGPDEEHFVTPVVVHLLNSGRVKFVNGMRHHRVICT